ncbi:MOSC N-terminal beta barrel domain-containing protein [Streptomonospora salina]|uniref:Uncharacterized protein YcbX n=1 Tax=Streptomonospora salina TaxID=104205 RepID=A0A841EFJ5_9ACTN|nr:MOSC N-terminal beta barrel domain-containing protein [Streptomonospora salina]MBB5999658.1 uncharacterized protein YcbX [Streptomonospora salina]
MAVVTEMYTYPVKGCAGVPVTEAPLTEAGLAHDRTFMVVSESGVFRSQRGEPRPALVRPDIVLDGWDRPHLEDEVRRVSIGGSELSYAELATRCAVTTVDQNTGAKSGREPLRALSAYRRASAGGVVFGAKFSVVRSGTLVLGEDAVVTGWGESER